MAKRRIWILALFLAAGVSLFSLQDNAHAVSCDAIVGDWAWFTGGNVTLNPDGTITSKEFGSLGTWECTNTTRGVFTLRWVFGSPPFVDTLTLSADGQSLSGKNQFQYPVTASRISTARKDDFDVALPEKTTDDKPLLDAKVTVNTLLVRGQEYFNESKYDDAIAEFTKAIEISPKDPFLHYMRGRSYQEKGQDDPAMLDYSKAVEIDPNYALAYRYRGIAHMAKGEYGQAVSDLDKFINKSKQKDIEAYNLRGTAKFKNGKFDWALDDYNKAIELNPKYAEAYNNRGIVHYKLDQQGKALNDFLKARDLGFDVNIEQLGELVKLRSEGKIPTWEVAEAMLHFDAGIGYYRGAGTKDKAIAEFTKAVELDPNYAAAYIYRGMAYDINKQYKNSVSDFSKFAELDSKDGELYATRAHFYRKKDKYGEAVNDFSKAIKYDPKNTENYYWRGNIYTKVGRHEAVIPDYTKLIELSPKDIGAYNGRAFAYMKTEQYEKAVSDYSKIIELYPKNGEAYYNRASAYKAMGDSDKSDLDFKKAAELGYKAKE